MSTSQGNQRANPCACQIIVIKTAQIFQFSSWTHGRIVLLPPFSGQQWPCEFLWVITWEVLCVISVRCFKNYWATNHVCFTLLWRQLEATFEMWPLSLWVPEYLQQAETHPDLKGTCVLNCWGLEVPCSRPHQGSSWLIQQEKGNASLIPSMSNIL